VTFIAEIAANHGSTHGNPHYRDFGWHGYSSVKAGAALGRAPRLIPFPPIILRLCARIVGKAEAADRLLASFEVDQAHIAAELGWRPPVSTDAGLRATAVWYRDALMSRK